MSEQRPFRAALIVDDDVDNQMILKAFLEKTGGYSIRTADSGQAGLAAIEEEKPDILLLDVLMPDINGPDLCVQIRNNDRFCDMIIILISGAKISPEDHAFGLELGADDYISRPFLHRELMARINAIFRLREIVGRKRSREPYSSLQDRTTHQTAAIYDQSAISMTASGEFLALVETYLNILRLAIEQRFYKIEYDISTQTSDLAERLGFLQANARDVIEIHTSAVKECFAEDSAKRSFYVKEESKILLVELMGHLVNYYRNRA